MKAQAASLPFTPIYAATCAIVNSKLPQVGELLITRLVVQFKKAFKRNDKAVCLSSTHFLAHLVNVQIVHETLIAKILVLLLERPTDDSVEIAIGLMREVGQHLEEMNAPIALLVFDRFRNILHESDLDKRVQYMVEVLFHVRKDKFKDNPAIKEELDLVEEEDQITHQIDLEDGLQTQDTLNIFKFDEEWEEHEEAYRKIKAEILGEASGSEGDTESGESSDEEEEEKVKEMEIKDQTNADLVNLRRTIYLTIMSSIDFEECTHKLMKLKLPLGLEPELPSMIIECCSQERTYSKFYGLMGERFAKLNRLWTELYEASFQKYYETIHRFESSRLRNIARFFSALLSSDAIGWHVLSIIHLNENETTSSSRIFIKILFQDLSESLGMPKLRARFQDPALSPSFGGIFPKDDPRNIRFSINYFTSIGMGAVTEEMREYLKSMPKPAVPALPAARARSASGSESVSSYSSYTGSSRSYSRSRSPSRTRGRSRSYSRTPPKGAARRRSYTPSASRSPSPAPRRRNRSYSYSSRSASSSTSPLRGRKENPRGKRNASRSLTPPSRRAAPRRRSSYTPSPSRSPSPPRRRGPAGRRSHSPSRSPSPYRREQGKDRDAYRARSSSPPPKRARRNTSSPESRERRRSPVYDAPKSGGAGAAARGAREGRRRAEDYL